MSICVAHVNVARGYRGGERQTELLIRELDGDVEQVLIARRGQPLARRLADVDVEIREVSGNFIGVALVAGGVDLLHVHEGRSVYGAYLRSLFAGTPYVLTRRVDNPIKNHRIAHAAYRRAAAVVAVAPQVAEIVERYDPRINVRVIHSGSSGLAVDADNVAAIRRGFPGKFIVGHVGALDNAQKGQEFIIAVARELQHAAPALQFVLVGGGADEAWLKAAAAGLDNVSFTGFVDNVGDYLAAFDLFVLPSRREGIGSILLDAMDRGLAVVAACVGGVPEIVHDEATGLLIDPETPAQLEAAILRLYRDPLLRRRLGDAGQALAKSYTAAVMAAKYLEIYRAVVADRLASDRRSAPDR
jgi:glycosyltransferase involved in cell wall biosynthesis